jgi:NAD(P)-dependent dehydrogenase (short-subunit alcohol dehydrogenase family)
MAEQIITGRSQALLAEAAARLVENSGDIIVTGINSDRAEELEKLKSFEPKLAAPQNRHERRAAAATR